MNEQERATQVKLAATGDQDALQRLIVLYHAALRGVVEREIDEPMRRRIDPDDVLQEAYVAAFGAVTDCTFDTPAGFYKWLETIALNRLKNRKRALKQQKRDVGREVSHRASTTASYPDLIQRLTSPQSTPSRHLRKAEASAAVMSCLARLSDDQREVIRLRFLEGKPVAEVAAHLGKTEAAVHGLCRRGIRALREALVSITRFLTRL